MPASLVAFMQAFNRANRINEVGSIKRDALRPAVEPAQIMHFLCSPEAADLNGQIVNARDGVVRARAGVPALGNAV